MAGWAAGEVHAEVLEELALLLLGPRLELLVVVLLLLLEHAAEDCCQTLDSPSI
jgi:hypothetical protein